MANREVNNIITHNAASAGTTGFDQDATQFDGILLFINITALGGTTPSVTATISALLVDEQ